MEITDAELDTLLRQADEELGALLAWYTYWWRALVSSQVCRSHGFTDRWACRRPRSPWGD